MRKFIYLLLCMVLLIGCTHQSNGNNGTSSTTGTTLPVVTTTTPVVTTTPTVVEIPKPEYHEELMNGNFSAIAGTYENSSGRVIRIDEDGRQLDIGSAGGVTYSHGIYTIERPYNQATYIYPVGVDVLGDATGQLIIKTDTSKMRVWTGYNYPKTGNDICIKISDKLEGLPPFHDQLINGDFSALAGEYINAEGKSFVLDVTGLRDGEVSHGEVRMHGNSYSMDVGAVGAVDGLYSLFIYPVGSTLSYWGFAGEGPTNTDTSKLRIYHGQAEPMSINEIYTKVENSQVDISSYEMKMGYQSYDCSKSGLEIFGVKMEEDSNYFQIVLNPDGGPWDDMNFSFGNGHTSYRGEFRRSSHDRFSVELGKFTDKHINPDPSAKYKEDRAEFYFRLVDDKLYYLTDDIPWEEWDTYTSDKYCVLQ